MRKCPSPSKLETFATDSAVDPALNAHIARCAACRESAEEIRANRRFLADEGAGLAAAFDASGIASEPGPRRLLPPPGTVPGFELIEEISRGGQGVVYRGIHTDTKRSAAVKMLLAGEFASGPQHHRFAREIEIAAGLRHPAIVSVFESGVTRDGRRYVAMEYVSGIPLDQFVRERLPLKDHGGRDRTIQIMRLIRMVAEGVGHAHASGVMHRDLKPSNILIDNNGSPRVLDFGLARSTEPGTDATITHEFAGTPAYAAPEQFASDLGPVSTRTDVYSLGVILYNSITGRHPYPCDGRLMSEISRHVIATEPTPPSRLMPRLPGDVDTIVLKALSKNPARRYSSAADMAADIDDYLNGRPISARRDSTLYVLKRLAMKHRILTLAATLVVLTIIGATIGLTLLARDLDQARRTAVTALSDSTVQRARLMGAAGDVDRAELLLWQEADRAGMSIDDSLCYVDNPQALRSTWSLNELYARMPRLFRARAGFDLAQAGINAADRIWSVDTRGSRRTWSLGGRLLEETTPLIPADSKNWAVSTQDGRYAAIQSPSSLIVRNLDTGETISGPAAWPGDFRISDISDDGSLLLSAAA